MVPQCAFLTASYISYLLWHWPLLSFRVGFSYIVRIICDSLCTLSKYRFWILIVCWQNTCIWWPRWYQNRWPHTVYDRWPAIFSVGFFGLSPFYAWRILHSTSLLRLSVRPSSVRPSVSRKVCPRRRAVSLRQLSFLLGHHPAMSW